MCAEMMKKQCPHLDECQFHLIDFEEIDETSPWNLRTEYLLTYCLGPLQEVCYRAWYLRTHGERPPENVSPTGLVFNRRTDRTSTGDTPPPNRE